VNGENESMQEVDMDGSESDQELTGNETDESEYIRNMLNFCTGYTFIIWYKTVYAFRKPLRYAVY
jgi:hypothetical protein